jgi:hypothetical protein
VTGALLGVLFSWGNGAQAALETVAEDPGGYTFRLRAPEPEAAAVEEADGRRLVALKVPGWPTTAVPGRPQVPYLGAMIPVPEGVGLGVEILEDRWQDQMLGRVLPAPGPEPDLGTLEGLRGSRYVEDAAAYGVDGLEPQTLVRVEPAGVARDRRLARVEVFPLQYNAARGLLRHHTDLVFRVRFLPGAGPPPTRDLGRVQGARDQGRGDIVPFPSVKVLVERDGIHTVRGRQLRRAGVPIEAIHPSTYRLSVSGQEVPIHVPAQERGATRLRKKDFIVFFGERNRSEYSRTNVYWLTWGGTAGLRMERVDGAPQDGTPEAQAVLRVRRHEKDFYYWYSMPNGATGEPRSDSWFWWKLYAGGGSFPPRAEGEFTMSLERLSQGGEEARLRIALKDRDNPGEHHTAVYVNGHLVDDRQWDPADCPEGECVLDLAFPQAVLGDGDNVLTVHSLNADPAVRSILYLNWFETETWHEPVAVGGALGFSYPAAGRRVFRLAGFGRRNGKALLALDVTDPKAPKIFFNGASRRSPAKGQGVAFLFEDELDRPKRYEVAKPASAATPALVRYDGPVLTSPGRGADYILIVPEAFEEAVAPLAAHRSAPPNALRVFTARLQDVYDEFGFGLKDPRAIRDFLEHAYNNWSPPSPLFVLLVGDANIDYLQNSNADNPYQPVTDLRQDWVPTWIARSLHMGDTPSDNAYVCVTRDAGGVYDPLPDMIIGRIPARTARELEAVVAKILAFEANSPAAPWSKELLFVADQTFEPITDGLIADLVPAAYTAHTLYLSSYTAEQCNNTQCDAGRDALQQQIAQGRSLAVYVGHGNYYNWAGEMILRNEDVGSLQNQDRLSLFLTFTCLNGYYAWWHDECLAEKLILQPQRGGIAAFSPTQMGLVEDHEVLARDLLDALFVQGRSVLGLAVWEAKLKSPLLENLAFYTLLGDPALRLPFP